MALSHIGSVLNVKDMIVGIDDSTIVYFPFINHANDVIRGQSITSTNTTLVSDGIAIEEGTVNLVNPDAALNNYGVTTRMVEASGPFKGWYRVNVTSVGTGKHICYIPYVSCTANTTYTFSIEYYAPNADIDLKVDGSNSYGNMVSPDGSYKYISTVTPTSTVSEGFWWYHKTVDNAAVNTYFYYRYAQCEQKAFATAFVNGSRASDAVVIIPDSIKGGLTQWTVSLEAKFDDPAGNTKGLFDFRWSGGINVLFYVSNTNNLGFYYLDGNNTNTAGGVAAPVTNVNSWNTYTLSYDGTTLRGYFNGALLISKVTTLGNNNTASGYLCYDKGSNPTVRNGVIRDFAIYNRALSADEITTLSNSPLYFNSEEGVCT